MLLRGLVTEVRMIPETTALNGHVIERQGDLPERAHFYFLCSSWNAPSEVVHQLGYDYPVLGGLNDGWKARKTRRYCAKASAS